MMWPIFIYYEFLCRAELLCLPRFAWSSGALPLSNRICAIARGKLLPFSRGHVSSKKAGAKGERDLVVAGAPRFLGVAAALDFRFHLRLLHGASKHLRTHTQGQPEILGVFGDASF